MVQKTLAVRGLDGAGKKTVVGSLLYKCGLKLNLLEKLEANTSRKYAEIPTFFDQNNIEKSFYAPSGQIVVDDSTSTPDIALWVVDVCSSDGGVSSSEALASLVLSGSFKPKEKLVILLNKMDLIHWSQQALDKVTENFKHVTPESIETSLVPISAITGDNVLELPNIPWVYENQVKTLAEALG